MAHTLNVLIIHGIGWGEKFDHYADRLEKNIKKRFDQAIRQLQLPDVKYPKSRRALRFESVYWSPVTQEPQDALIDLVGMAVSRLLRPVNFSYQARKQLVGLVGDVIAYGGGERIYKAIHDCVDACTTSLSDKSTNDRNEAGYAQLTIIGHSLGSIIASDFVWDHHQRGSEQPHLLPDYHLSLKNMILLGSPMALYALRNSPYATKQELAECLDEPIRVDPNGGLWLNMYDQQDPIGLPLSAITSYGNIGVIDYAVRSGNFLTAWNPLSHVGYWRSVDAANIIGDKLALDWAALNSPHFAENQYDQAVEALRTNLRNRKR